MVFQKSPNIKFHENPCGRTDGLIDIMKLIVVFTIFQMCRMLKIWVSGLCLCGISNKAYFVTNFCVNTKTSFTGILDSVVRVRGILHNVGGVVKLGCGTIRGNFRGRNMLVPGLSENEAKNYLLLHASFITSKLVQD
jgi:hypothetical protein